MQHNKSLDARSIILCAMFAALIAVGAFIKIPIPVAPFTLQFLFTNLAGLLLGKKLASISVGVYLLIGLIGIPVFTGGGGLSYIFVPTFGYLIGFLVGAYVTGSIVEKIKNITFKSLLLASFSGLGIVYLFGMIYYYFISNYYLNAPIGVWSLILYCFILAVPGDILICFVSSFLSKRLIPIVKRG